LIMAKSWKINVGKEGAPCISVIIFEPMFAVSSVFC